MSRKWQNPGMIAVFLVVSAGLAPAATLTVGPGAGYDFNTVQVAIDAAGPGDVVVAAPGVYLEDISFNGTNITVTSEFPDDPCCVATTIIQGTGTGSVVTFFGSEDQSCVLEGFTITDGNAPWFGGGVYGNGTGATVRKCIIRNNQAIFGGGGGLSDCHGQISNCTIRDNMADHGCGAGLSYCHGLIKNCLVRGNSAGHGGGLSNCYGTISNCTITYNVAYWGGGLLACTGPIRNCTITNNAVWEYGSGLQDCSGPISNCTIAGNSGSWSAGLSNCSGSITNCIIWGNNPRQLNDCSTPTYSCVGSGGSDGIGNISDDPWFVNPDAGDYHLQVYSPCINAGDPSFVAEPGEVDIDGETRVFAGRVDMGADEYVGHLMPIADAGPDRYFEQVQLVALNGSGSFFYNPLGTKEFQWTQIAGPEVELSDPTAVVTTFLPEVEAEYLFELVVSDYLYTSHPDEVLIVVGNRPPVADAGADILCRVGDRVWVDGSGSYDPDPGDEVTYTWAQLQGPNVVLYGANTSTPYFDCNEWALYEFELIVSDGEDDSQPSRVQVVTVDLNVQQQELDVRYDGGINYNYPDISGDKVVYASNFACPLSWDLKCKDMTTGDIYEFHGGGIHAQPKIDGDLIVLFGAKSSGDISAYDRSSISYYYMPSLDQETLRGYTATESYSHPAISGTKVVWLEHLNLDPSGAPGYNLPYNICGADVTELSHPTFFTIATDVGKRDVTNCAIYEFDDVVDICGHLVVWEGGGDIYGADISDLNDIEVFPICTHPSRQFDPAVSGDVVVWTDERNDGGDIYGADIYDVENIDVFEVAKEAGRQEQAAIEGPVIVYVYFNDPCDARIGEIKVCHLTWRHGALGVPLTEPRYGVGPAIDGEAIVWQGRHHYDGLAEGISLRVEYTIADGPIQNLRTGTRHDYIQHAINAATEGDEIVLAEGLYHGSVDFKGKGLVLRSINPDDPAVAAATIINGDSRRPAVTVSGEIYSCAIEGLSITGGDTGIYCSRACPAITRCNITGNKGNGIEWWAWLGCRNPVICNCSITDNKGCGIRFEGSGYKDVVNCVIAGNIEYGVLGRYVIATNCTVVGNSLAGVAGYKVSAVNSIVRGNRQFQLLGSATASYSNVEGGWPGNGNIETDPCFAEPGYWNPNGTPDDANDDFWVPGDYHLKSQAGRWDANTQSWVIDANTSVCIDAGNPGCPVGSEPDPNGNRTNMGAYGGTPTASKSPPDWRSIADLNNDFTVDFNDVRVFVDYWLQSGPCIPSDLDRSQAVDFGDWSVVAEQWARQE